MSASGRLVLWKGRILDVAALIRLRPFDTSSEEGRSQERHRRVLLTALAAGVAKGVTILTLVLSVPLTIGYLGVERYGLWMTIGSVTAILGFADLGMGNGLLNAISEANGKDDRNSAREYVSSAFFMFCTMAVILGLLFALVYRLIPWQRVFNVKSVSAVAEAGPAMAVFVGCFLVSIPLGIVQRIQMGYQEGFANSLWQALGSVLGLVGVMLVIYVQGSLPWLVLAIAGLPVLAVILNGFVLFFYRRPWLLPRWSMFSTKAARRLLHLGVLFFVLQVAATLAFAMDNVIIAQVLGPQDVSVYAVTARMFSLAPMLLAMFLTPLWPAYAESVTRGDVSWARRTLMTSLGLSLLLSGVASALLVVFGDEIVTVWAGGVVNPSFSLLLGLGVWTVMSAGGNALAMFLSGINRISFQAVTATLMAAGALIAKIYLTQRIGLPGIPWGTVVSYTVFVVVPFAVYLPRLLTGLGRPRAAPAL